MKIIEITWRPIKKYRRKQNSSFSRVEQTSRWENAGTLLRAYEYGVRHRRTDDPQRLTRYSTVDFTSSTGRSMKTAVTHAIGAFAFQTFIRYARWPCLFQHSWHIHSGHRPFPRVTLQPSIRDYLRATPDIRQRRLSPARGWQPPWNRMRHAGKFRMRCMFIRASRDEKATFSLSVAEEKWLLHTAKHRAGEFLIEFNLT